MFNTQRLTNMWDRLTALEGLVGNTAPVVSNIQPKPLEIQQQEEVAILPVVAEPEPEPEPEDCCICMDAQLGGNGSVKLNCGHELCLKCFMNIMNARGMGTRNRCHLCRAPFRENTPPPVINGRVLQPLPPNFDDSDSEDENIDFAEMVRQFPVAMVRHNPPRRIVRQHRITQTQQRILDVMGNHPIPANIINDRITRNHVRPRAYQLQTVRNNSNTLVNAGLLRRVGRNYQRV